MKVPRHRAVRPETTRFTGRPRGNRTPNLRSWKPALSLIELSTYGSTGWDRTNALPVNSRALCQLSYRGIERDVRGERTPREDLRIELSKTRLGEEDSNPHQRDQNPLSYR